MVVKKDWNAPKLVLYGNVEDITLVDVCAQKQFGASDGFTFQGVPITCAFGS